MLDLLEERVHRRARETGDPLAMFPLKRRRPEKYGDQPRTIVQQPSRRPSTCRPCASTDCQMEGLNVVERVLRGVLEETRSKAQALEGEVRR